VEYFQLALTSFGMEAYLIVFWISAGLTMVLVITGGFVAYNFAVRLSLF
jgi:hypothetical protein